MKVQKRYAITDVSVIDGNGGAIIENAAVIIDGKKIEKVCESKQISGMDIQKISMKDRYVMPGLIDAHIHLTGVPDFKYWGIVDSNTALANSYSNALQMLKHGITSFRDISENGLYLKRAFAAPGVIGPRIVACGQGLNRTGGHCDMIYYKDLDFEEKNNMMALRADGTEEIRSRIRYLIRNGADQIKFWATGGGHNSIDRFRDVHYTEEEIQAICREAKLIDGTKVLAHCENPEVSKICIEAGVDSIEHCDGYSPEIYDLMMEHNVGLVPTMRLLTKWDKDYMNNDKLTFVEGVLPSFFQRDNQECIIDPETTAAEVRNLRYVFGHAIDNGVKVGMGSDTIWSNMTPYGKYSLMEMECMQECGMSADRIITAATKTNSEILGLEEIIGTVEAGKSADLLILSKNPTEDIRVLQEEDVIEYVLIEGRVAVDHGNHAL